MRKITEGRDSPIQGTILTRILSEETQELQPEESFSQLYIGSTGSGNGAAHLDPHAQCFEGRECVAPSVFELKIKDFMTVLCQKNRMDFNLSELLR